MVVPVDPRRCDLLEVGEDGDRAGAVPDALRLVQKDQTDTITVAFKKPKCARVTLVQQQLNKAHNKHPRHKRTPQRSPFSTSTVPARHDNFSNQDVARKWLTELRPRVGRRLMSVDASRITPSTTWPSASCDRRGHPTPDQAPVCGHLCGHPAQPGDRRPPPDRGRTGIAEATHRAGRLHRHRPRSRDRSRQPETLGTRFAALSSLPTRPVRSAYWTTTASTKDEKFLR